MMLPRSCRCTAPRPLALGAPLAVFLFALSLSSLVSQSGVEAQFPDGDSEPTSQAVCPLTGRLPDLIRTDGGTSGGVGYYETFCLDAVSSTCCSNCYSISTGLKLITTRISTLIGNAQLGNEAQKAYAQQTTKQWGNPFFCQYLEQKPANQLCAELITQVACAMTCNPDSGQYVEAHSSSNFTLRICPEFATKFLSACSNATRGAAFPRGNESLNSLMGGDLEALEYWGRALSATLDLPRFNLVQDAAACYNGSNQEFVPTAHYCCKSLSFSDKQCNVKQVKEWQKEHPEWQQVIDDIYVTGDITSPYDTTACRRENTFTAAAVEPEADKPLCAFTGAEPKLTSMVDQRPQVAMRCVSAKALTCSAGCQDISNGLTMVTTRIRDWLERTGLDPTSYNSTLSTWNDTSYCGYFTSQNSECADHIEQLACAMTSNPGNARYIGLNKGTANKYTLYLCPAYAADLVTACRNSKGPGNVTSLMDLLGDDDALVPLPAVALMRLGLALSGVLDLPGNASVALAVADLTQRTGCYTKEVTSSSNWNVCCNGLSTSECPNVEAEFNKHPDWKTMSNVDPLVWRTCRQNVDLQATLQAPPPRRATLVGSPPPFTFTAPLDPPSNGHGLSAGALAGIVVALLVVAAVLALATLLMCCKHKHRHRHAVLPSPWRAIRSSFGVKENKAVWEDQVHAAVFRKYRLDEIKRMTFNFDNSLIVGRGAYAVVYRAEARDGTVSAVKRQLRQAGHSAGSSELNDFEREVISVSQLKHRNLIRMMGYCIESSEQIQIYAFAERGSVEDCLHGNSGIPGSSSMPLKSRSRSGRKEYLATAKEGADRVPVPLPLSVEERIRIQLGAAHGLHYLHVQGIIHRDVKPANILVASNLTAKVSDFGLIKDTNGDSMGGSAAVSMLTRVAGTPGYMDPEYVTGFRISKGADVYSLGIVLLEMMTRRRPRVDSPNDLSLVAQFRRDRDSPNPMLTELSVSSISEFLGPPPQENDPNAPLMLREWAAILFGLGQIPAMLDPDLLRDGTLALASDPECPEAAEEVRVLKAYFSLALSCVDVSSKRPHMGTVALQLESILQQWRTVMGVSTSSGTSAPREDIVDADF